jgi:hypothetical protein
MHGQTKEEYRADREKEVRFIILNFLLNQLLCLIKTTHLTGVKAKGRRHKRLGKGQGKRYTGYCEGEVSRVEA